MYSFYFHHSDPLESEWLTVRSSSGEARFLSWTCAIAESDRIVATVHARQPLVDESMSFPRVKTIEEGRRIAKLMVASGDLVNGVNALLGLIDLIAGRDDISPEIRQAMLHNPRIYEAHVALAKAGYPVPAAELTI